MKTSRMRKLWVIGIFFVFLGIGTTFDTVPRSFWGDYFDSYMNDQFLDGGADDGGWNGWGYSPAAGAYVRDDYYHSGPYSVEISGASDLVHEFTGYDSGWWDLRTMIYIPVNFSGMSYFILLSGYDGGGSETVWAAQVRFDGQLGIVESEFNGETTTLIKGQWVEFRCYIDLDADWLQIFYNEALLAEHAYSDTVQGTGGGPLNIAAVDLFANSATPVYYDDMMIGFWNPPVVVEAGGPYSGYANQIILFNGSASGGMGYYSWEWDFGDGAIAYIQNPIHAYSVGGNYTAILTVTDVESPPVSDNASVTIYAVQPVLEIGAVMGGFGVKSTVKNTGGVATNVTWSVYFNGKGVCLGKSTTGSIATLAAGEEKAIKTGFIFGVGQTHILVSARCDEGVTIQTDKTGFVLGPFVLRVE